MSKRFYWCCTLSAAMIVPAGGVHANSADFLIGTGDHYVVGQFMPIDSPAFIDATFDMLRDVYGTQRIQWRGLQDQQILDSLFRPENALLADMYDRTNYLVQQTQINEYAVHAAHARGMEIWGRAAIYDWGETGLSSNTMFGPPGGYETNLRVENPQWVPVDRFGMRRQSGPIELGYADARQAVADVFTTAALSAGYDGVVLQVYLENLTTRYADEFGFNDPVVQDFQNRYGVDLRRDSFNIQDFRDLRGEYTTLTLQTIQSQLASHGIQLGMEVNGWDDPSLPSKWLLESPYPEAGAITQEWKKWIDQEIVDEVWLRRGITSPGGIEIIDYAQGKNVAISAFASNPFHPAFDDAEGKGVRMIGTPLMLHEAIRNSNLPAQTSAAYTSADPYARMKILQQVIDGVTVGTHAQVAPLVNDSNILVRRLALEALGAIGDPASVAVLEQALFDPESGIRTGALAGLTHINGPHTIGRIIDAVAAGGDIAVRELARDVLLSLPISSVEPVLVDALVNHPSSDVRRLAARTLWGRVTSTPGKLDAYMQAAADPDPYVRYMAVGSQLYESPTNQSLDALIGVMNGSDSVSATQAADVIGLLLQAGYVAARARETDLVQALSDRFADFGDQSADPNADWGYEVVGRALVNADYAGGPQAGRAALRQYMTQREDRLLSERAWEVLYIPNPRAQLTTSAYDSLADAEHAYLRRPRWDDVTAIVDTFDSASNGQRLDTWKPETGLRWTVLYGDPAQQVIQNQVAHSGNALKLFREENSVTSHGVRAEGHLYDTAVAEITTATLKADWLRLDATASAFIELDVGTDLDAAVFANADGYYWVRGAAGWRNTGVPYGIGGWETIEIVLSWGIADATADTVAGSYDVYLQRDGQSSLGALARTLIAQGIELDAVSLAVPMDIVISNQPNPFASGDIVTYWDAVSLRIAPNLPHPVPEPVAVVWLAGGVLLCRRRNVP